MKLHQINNVETLYTTSLQSKVKHIFMKKRDHRPFITLCVSVVSCQLLKGSGLIPQPLH